MLQLRGIIVLVLATSAVCVPLPSTAHEEEGYSYTSAAAARSSKTFYASCVELHLFGDPKNHREALDRIAINDPGDRPMDIDELKRSVTKEELIKWLQERGDTVYIADRDLVRFAKFALSVLAVLVVVGLFFWGVDIKKFADQASKSAADAGKAQLEASKAQFEASKAQSEANELSRKLEAQLKDERSAFDEMIKQSKVEIQKRIDEATESSKRVRGIELDVARRQIVIAQYIRQHGDVRGLEQIITAATSSQEVSTQAAIQPLALVSDSKALKRETLEKIAPSFQKQIDRDLQPIWSVGATIEVFGSLESVPKGYWPLTVKDEIGMEGAGGFHSSRDGEPYAFVLFDNDPATLSFRVSRQLTEMLVDPFGVRLMKGRSVINDQETVSYLVEIGHPVGDNGYYVDNIRVSDFVTPSYYSDIENSGAKYSFAGAVKSPHQLAKMGFLSWMKDDGEWHQMRWFDGDKPIHAVLGKVN